MTAPWGWLAALVGRTDVPADEPPISHPPVSLTGAEVVARALTDVVILPDGRRVTPSWHRTGDVAVRHIPVDGPRGEPEMIAGDTLVTVERRGAVDVPEASGPADVDPLRAGAAGLL